MKKIFFTLTLILLSFDFINAGGISVDAGITPPKDRFIFRSQFRYMSMDNSMMKMNSQMVPVVLAYGVTSKFTILARAIYIRQTIERSTSEFKGFGDPFLLAKFRLYRKNTSKYIIGIAPHIASNIPIGSDKVSNRSLNPEAGLNVSFRPRFYSVDISASYSISDITNKLENQPGDVINLNTAFSKVIPLKGYSSSAISPVIELTYLNQIKSNDIEGRDVLYLSPGASFIFSNLSIEALMQIPLAQTKRDGLMEQNTRSIFGVKYLF